MYGIQNGHIATNKKSPKGLDWKVIFLKYSVFPVCEHDEQKNLSLTQKDIVNGRTCTKLSKKNKQLRKNHKNFLVIKKASKECLYHGNEEQMNTSILLCYNPMESYLIET